MMLGHKARSVFDRCDIVSPSDRRRSTRRGGTFDRLRIEIGSLKHL